MDPATIGALSVAGLILLILIGFHVGVALALTSFIGLYFVTGRFGVAASVLEKTAFSAVMDYVFAVIPLFVLMGLATTASGATRELFVAAETLMGRIRGGLGIATVMANAVFAAITGVSIASAAVFSKIAVPEMLRLNYDRRFSLGIVAASSLLGMLIPPSILMIIYGVITEQSVGRLFAAGVGPGLLVTLLLCAAIFALVAARPHLGGRLLRGDAAAPGTAGSGGRNPHHGPPQDADPRDTAPQDDAPLGISAGEATRQMIRPWPVYILIILVLGGIYGGIFTPTEAGAIGAFGALVLLGMRRKFTVGSSWTILLETGKATAAIFLLLITAQMYSRMLTLSGLPAEVSNWAVNLDIGATGVVLIFVLVLLMLGTILDSVSILLLTMPIMYPVTQTLGLDPIWFGIVAIIAIEIGLLTPPFGMVIFAMKAALPRDVGIEEIYAGTAPFLVVLLIALALTIAAPAITLWLPTAIYG